MINVFHFDYVETITALWYAFAFSIMLGALFGFVLKPIFDWSTRYFPKGKFRIWGRG